MARKEVDVMGLGLVGLLMMMMMMGFKRVDGFFGVDRHNNKVMHMEGKVLCQDCTKNWNDWAKDAKPINGAKVAVTCVDDRRRVIFHATGETNQRGEFDIPVSTSTAISSKKIKPENCLMRVLSSSEPACRVLTDFGGGKSGVRPDRPSVLHPAMVKFTAEPFYFTSQTCDDPTLQQ